MVSLEQIVAVIVDDVVADYRIDPEAAHDLIAPLLSKDAKLNKAAAKAKDTDGLCRTRAFKEARKKARNIVYYTLRQYKRTDLSPLVEQLREADNVAASARDILDAHSSTRERLVSREAFAEKILDAIGPAKRVLDVGGGVAALMFPFERAPTLELYLSLDRDAAVTEAVQAYAARRPEPRLFARQWALKDGWNPLDAPFDVALLLKIVPVVARQDPALLHLLAATPARRLVISGSRVALTKKASIEDRERRLLERWITDHGLVFTGQTFELEEELFLIVERGVPKLNPT
ncbi:MAG: hypothetical protein AAF449_02240 [Myxococcota bacterium]